MRLLASPEGMASNVLADRLARLQEGGIVEQRANPEHRGRPTYHLTDRGTALGDVLDAVARWGLKQFPGTTLGGHSIKGVRRVSGKRASHSSV